MVNNLIAILIVAVFLLCLTLCSANAQTNTVSSTSSTISSTTVDRTPNSAIAPSIVQFCSKCQHTNTSIRISKWW